MDTVTNFSNGFRKPSSKEIDLERMKSMRIEPPKAPDAVNRKITVRDAVADAPRGSVKKVGSGSRLVGGAMALAGIEGAAKGMNTSTKEYAERMGIDEPESVLGKTAVRTAGVLSDVGEATGVPGFIRKMTKGDAERARFSEAFYSGDQEISEEQPLKEMRRSDL